MTVTFKDFKKLDIRIGTVVKAEVPKWSHWVMKLTVDLGDPPAGGGKKTAFAGIMMFYKEKDIIGKQFPFIVNLEPKKIGPEGEFSEVMILAASKKLDVPIKVGQELSEEKPVLFNLLEKVPNGTKVR